VKEPITAALCHMLFRTSPIQGPCDLCPSSCYCHIINGHRTRWSITIPCSHRYPIRKHTIIAVPHMRGDPVWGELSHCYEVHERRGLGSRNDIMYTRKYSPDCRRKIVVDTPSCTLFLSCNRCCLQGQTLSSVQT
jgi:hypothetical protein